MTLTPGRKMSSLSTPRSLYSSVSLSKRSTLSYHTQNLLLYPHSLTSLDENDHKEYKYNLGVSTSPLLEAVYLFLMAGTGIILGYLASNLPWPERFAPILGLGLLFYLIITHTTLYSPFNRRTPPSRTDEESTYTVAEQAMMSKGAIVEDRDVRLKAILAEKRAGRLAGVFAFGKSNRERSGMSDGSGQVWVIVEDMDA